MKQKSNKAKKRIYLDYAAGTPVDPRVLSAMLPYFSRDFGNPSGIYQEGVSAKGAIARARAQIGKALGARSDEIIFTSGGTEANNLAIFGVAAALQEKTMPLKKTHFITSVIEHHSVPDCFRELERRGAQVSYVPVTKDGIIDLRAFREALQPETVLVSIMYANNEIGTIQPLHEIAKIIRNFMKETRNKGQGTSNAARLIFHTDASQAPLYLDCNIARLGVQMLTLDAQKIYGPKGAGLLYLKKGVELAPLFYGGGQERGLRSGTENVPGIVGLAKAMEIATEERTRESARLAKLRDYLIDGVLQSIPGAELNGSRAVRLPNNANFFFPGVDGEWLLFQLDARGIAVGTKSACLSEKEAGSYVMRALGRSDKDAASNIRITLGRGTTKNDIDTFGGALCDILTKRVFHV